MSTFVSRYPDLLRRAVGHLLYPSITRQSVRASHIMYRSLASSLSRHPGRCKYMGILDKRIAEEESEKKQVVMGTK